MPKRNPSSALLLFAILVSAISARSQAPTPSSSPRLFAPYVDMSLTSAEDLVAVQKQIGIKAVTLAFLSASGNACAAGWGGLHQTLPSDKLPNGTTVQTLVKQLQAAGVEVIISIGGQSGTEPALRCKTGSSLQALYQSVIDRYGVTRLDFDIEGKATTDQLSITRRDQALAALKKADPRLVISYTVEVMPTGLVDSGVKMLRSARRDGLDIDLINIMAMDYGAGEDNNGQMGKDAIDAVEATQKQFQSASLDAKLGITVMIGVNDEKPEVFTPADAQAVLDFAMKDSSVALLSLWSLQRDNASCAGAKSAKPTCSGLRQSEYQFSRAFAAFSK